MAASVEITEVRVLEGPNLYFPRPAGKIGLAVPGYMDADSVVLQRIGEQLQLRRRDAGNPGSPVRRQYVASLVERVVRMIARQSGTSRLAVRVRMAGETGLVVAFALRHRGRVAAMADALAQVLPGLLDGQEAEPLLATTVVGVTVRDGGELLRPMRPKVPVVAVTGTNGKTTTTRLIAHLAMTAGLRTGWSSTDGVLVQGELIEYGDYSGPAGARAALAEGVQFGVLETARGGMLLKGLGTAYNDVSVVTNVSADHLGMNGIDTVDQLAEVKAIITKVTKQNGWVVLNGDDPRVWAMRTTASAPVWCFSLDPDSPSLRESRDSGGRGITVDDGMIMLLVPGRAPEALMPVVDIPMTLCGLSAHNLANALAGAAAGLGAGLPRDAVVEGLRTFVPDAAHNAGRMNIYSLALPDGDGEVTIILDMAHNEGGLEALLRVARGLTEPGSNLLLGLGTGGDRTDEILRNLGEMAGRDADRVHIQHKVKYLRDRTTEDLEAKLVEGLTRVGVTPVSSSPTEFEGLQALLGDAHDGDVLALMTHSDRALLHDWIVEQGGSEDAPETVRQKVIRARGEHLAEDRIAALWQIEDPDERVRVGTELRREFPHDARVLYEYAGTYDSAGREEEALEAYDAALAAGLREPYRRRALIQKASTLRHLRRLEESARILDELAREWPENDAIAVFRAVTMHDAGADAAALGDLLRRLVHLSTDPEVERYRRSLTAFTDEVH